MERAFRGSSGVPLSGMKTLLLAASALLALASPQGAPINTMCPVKPRQKAKPSLTVIYEGQVIAFC